MKLWLISQDENRGYDTYDSAVVAAETEADARNIHPGRSEGWGDYFPTWSSSPDKVTARYIGEAMPGTEPGVILASFNAG